MNISGIRPKQEFYAGVEKQEPEKKEMHRLNQVAIRMVEMPPLFSEEPMNGPAAAVKVMADTFRDYDREVVAVVNLRADMRPININIASIGALDQSIAHPRRFLRVPFCPMQQLSYWSIIIRPADWLQVWKISV